MSTLPPPLAASESSVVNPEQATALATVALLAAFADGGQSDAERGRVREVVESLGNPNLSGALRSVVMKETDVARATAQLTTPGLRTLAWESALAVCEADGATTPAERAFLDELATRLERPLSVAQGDVVAADALHHEPTAAPVAGLPAVVPVPVPARAADPRDEQTEASVLKYAILTAAVELLPQNMATLAIIPLQVKMVHGVGSAYGYNLSTASIKEFVATVGIGMTGQVVEQQARKLLSSIAGRFLGGIGRTAVNWGTGPVMTFATTYAIGRVARQYYAGGRTLSAVNLRTLFGQEVEKAKGLYSQYEPQIRETAAKTNPAALLQSLRA